MEKKVKLSEIGDNIIKVKYKGKTLIINISEELSINENIINSQLKIFPLTMLFYALYVMIILKKGIY